MHRQTKALRRLMPQPSSSPVTQPGKDAQLPWPWRGIIFDGEACEAVESAYRRLL